MHYHHFLTPICLVASLQSSPLQASKAQQTPGHELRSAQLEQGRGRSPATLTLRYDPPLAQTSIQLELGDGRPTQLNDRGQGADRVAGDGVYTGRTKVDVETEIANLRAHLRRNSGRTPQLGDFHGRELIARTPFDAQPMRERIQAWRRWAKSNRGRARIELVEDSPMRMAATTDWEKTLMIRDPSVVGDPTRTNSWAMVSGTCTMTGDPDGPWAFQHLLKEMAGTSYSGLYDGQTMLDNILDSFFVTSLSGQNLKPPPAWQEFIGPPTSPGIWPLDGSGEPDFDLAPFKLLAIVNRTDLRGPFNALTAAGPGYPGGGTGTGSLFGYIGDTAGELRFVFGAIDPATCEPLNMTLIFEYTVPTTGCLDTKARAQSWVALDALSLGSASYNAALQAITDPIISEGAGAGPGFNPTINFSLLKQLRINENLINWPHYPGRAWRMRQLSLQHGDSDFGPSFTGQLRLALLPATPVSRGFGGGWQWSDNWSIWHDDLLMNGPPNCTTCGVLPVPQDMTSFIVSEATNIIAGNYSIPLDIAGTPMLAADVEYGELYRPFGGTEPFSTWIGARAFTPSDPEYNDYVAARHELSLGSCHGCHHREVFDDGQNSPLGPQWRFSWASVPENSVTGASAEVPNRHIIDQGPGLPAQLSRFLTGTDQGCVSDLYVAPLGTETCGSCCPIGDAAFGGDVAQYHYADLDLRGQDLDTVATQSCILLEAVSVSESIAPAAIGSGQLDARRWSH